jgi:DNA replication protein DnaC
MNMNQLKLQLKTLKLSGMCDNLELRLVEAQQNQLAYTEFLTMLLNDEIEIRNSRKLKRLIQSARIRNDQTLETFDFSFNPSINAAHIRELATCNFIERAEGIFFIGPTGTGKSHLAYAICHQACRKYLNVVFYKFHELFDELNKAEQRNQLSKLIRKLTSFDLLAIDDFAFKKIDQISAEFLYTIIDTRYQTKSTIITSNRAMSDWAAIFPDPIMANAILDRMAHNAHQIIMKGESYRKKFKPKKLNA